MRGWVAVVLLMRGQKRDKNLIIAWKEKKPRLCLGVIMEDVIYYEK